MNKNRKNLKKGWSLRLTALLLCVVFLCGFIGMGSADVAADEADVENTVSEVNGTTGLSESDGDGEGEQSGPVSAKQNTQETNAENPTNENTTDVNTTDGKTATFAVGQLAKSSTLTVSSNLTAANKADIPTFEIAQGASSTITIENKLYEDRSWRAVDSTGNQIDEIKVVYNPNATPKSLTITVDATVAVGTYTIQYIKEYGDIADVYENAYTVEVTMAEPESNPAQVPSPASETSTNYGTSNLYFYVQVKALPEGSDALNDISIESDVWVDVGATTINSRSETSSLGGKDGKGNAWGNAFATDTVEEGQPFASGTYNIGENSNHQKYIYGGGTDNNSDGKLDDITRLSNLNAVDAYIRNIPTTGVTVTNADGSASYKYEIASVPSDEEVLKNVRDAISSGNKTITINEQNISADEMTTANFMVKWYVIKDSQSSGWHCDGYLIAKTAYMKVTKTFAGNSTAINAVKARTGNDAYSISVTGDSTNNSSIVHDNYTLTLTAADSSTKSTAQSGNIYYDPTESDPANNYYVWYVPVDYLYDYSVTENNWTANTINGFTYETTATYSVTNSADSEDNESGTYSDTDTPDVQGTSQATSNANPLTVQFQNVYTPDGTVAIHKVDSTTGNGWADVTFTITGNDGKAFNVVRDETGYYIQATDGSGANTVTTDAYGMIYLKDFPSGTYVLTETTPEGYKSIGKITITISTSGDNNKKTSQITGLTYDKGDAEDTSTNPATINSNGKVMTVTNTAETATLKVQKVWATGDTVESVVLNFLQNGNQFGVIDQTISSYTNNKSDEITVSNYVPLYIDGKLASYTVQELKIGKTNISEGSYGGDGYRNYDWSQKTEIKDNEILITVTNEKDRGDATFTKVDESGNPVSGATFTVYDGFMPTMPLAEYATVNDSMNTRIMATSDNTGTVKFANLFNDNGNTTTGYYYMQETTKPEGFKSNDTLYLLERTDGGAINIYKLENSVWVPVTDNKIVNEHADVTLTVTKKVSGNMGDQNESFAFTVTSDRTGITSTSRGVNVTVTDGRSAAFSLKHGDSVSLTVPYGATIGITETANNGYTTTYEVTTGTDGTANGQTYTIAGINNTTSVTVTNTKEVKIDTGVSLSTVPYIVILAISLAGVALILKRRRGAAE